MTATGRFVRVRKRVRHFLILRLAIALAGFLLVQLWREGLSEESSAGVGLFLHLVLGCYLCEALLALILLKWVRRTYLYGAAQVALDLGTVGTLVAATGGATSIFCPLFFAVVLAPSTVFDVRGAVVSSTAATVTLAIATVLPYVVPELGRHATLNVWKTASAVLTYAIGLHVVCVLSARLAGNLTEAMNLTSDIVETMGEGLVATDRSGRVLVLNNEARRLLGLSGARKFEGGSLLQLLSQDGRKLLWEAVICGRERHLKTTLRRADGTTVPVEIKATDLRGRRGEVRGTVILLSDLTLQQRVGAAVRRIAKLEELTEVARSIAHEVRNPLASMCGCAEEIARDPSLRGETKELAGILVREAHRVDNIIDDFLTFARIRSVRREPVSVSELVRNVAVLLRARIRHERQHVAVAEPAGEYAVLGDRNLLTQVLLNVGINALEALGEGSGEVRLAAAPRRAPFSWGRRQSDRDDRGVELLIADTGRGIAPEKLSKIFNPFFSGKARGTGLGLTIAHRIVQLHGGAIHVESEQGRGTTFRIWLPAAREMQAEATTTMPWVTTQESS